MATRSLRPLSVGEILDAGVKILTRHWKPLALCVVGLVLPLYIVYTLALAAIDPDALKTSNTFSTTTSSSSSDEIDAAALGGILVSAVVLIVTFLIAFTACFRAVSDAWLGGEPDVRRSLRFGLRQSPRLLLLSIVYSIPVLIGFVLFIVPGVWLMVAWAVCIPALLFERIGPLKSLSRSFSLIKGRWWASAVLLVVCYLLVSVVSFLIEFGLLGIAQSFAKDSAIAGGVAQVVGSTVSTAITYPYFAAVLTILYFDQRVRKEGLDLQLQAEGVRDPDAPLPAPLVGAEPEQRAAASSWPPSPDEEPAWSSQSGWTAPERPSSSYPTQSPSPAERDDDSEEPGRASWLPPEAPRGPGGL